MKHFSLSFSEKKHKCKTGSWRIVCWKITTFWHSSLKIVLKKSQKAGKLQHAKKMFRNVDKKRLKASTEKKIKISSINQTFQNVLKNEKCLKTCISINVIIILVQFVVQNVWLLGDVWFGRVCGVDGVWCWWCAGLVVCGLGPWFGIPVVITDQKSFKKKHSLKTLSNKYDFRFHFMIIIIMCFRTFHTFSKNIQIQIFLRVDFIKKP